MRLFTREEMRDIIISILAIALIFAYPNLRSKFFEALFIVIFSFFLHEMAHKFMARRLHCTATYKLWPMGILFGILLMLLKPIMGGLIFLAPGFVEIMPYTFGRLGIKLIKMTPRDYGAIALAGVGVNLFFAIFFRLFTGEIFHTISLINAFLAFFNLLPIPSLDGEKIFVWGIFWWLFLIVLAGIFIVI